LTSNCNFNNSRPLKKNQKARPQFEHSAWQAQHDESPSKLSEKKDMTNLAVDGGKETIKKKSKQKMEGKGEGRGRHCVAWEMRSERFHTKLLMREEWMNGWAGTLT